MTKRESNTYYVTALLGKDEAIKESFMVDTGSSYSTINEDTMKSLPGKEIRFSRNLKAVLANGSEMEVPLYQISSFRIGSCKIKDHEVAVFPGNARMILGLNTLRFFSPFLFSVESSELSLSNCNK